MIKEIAALGLSLVLSATAANAASLRIQMEGSTSFNPGLFPGDFTADILLSDEAAVGQGAGQFESVFASYVFASQSGTISQSVPLAGSSIQVDLNSVAAQQAITGSLTNVVASTDQAIESVGLELRFRDEGSLFTSIDDLFSATEDRVFTRSDFSFARLTIFPATGSVLDWTIIGGVLGIAGGGDFDSIIVTLDVDDVDAPVPLPGAALLFAPALLGLVGVRKKI